MAEFIRCAVLFTFILCNSGPSILGQDKNGTLIGVVWEQKIACGPTGCLINYWQDLNGDGDVDIVTLYAVPTDGEKRFIMQEQIHSKRDRKEI